MLDNLFRKRALPLLSVASSCLCLIGIATEAAAQKPEIIVEIEKTDVYEGESVLYRVTLNHVENPTAPKLEGFDDFQVIPLGEQSLDSRQITIINGRRSEIVRRGRQYNYRLTPLKSGTFALPAPTAEVDGEVLTGRELTLRVRPPDEQDAVDLEFTSDRTTVYPMQPFELTLTIAVKALPGDLQDRDPLSVQQTPPALNIGWLDDDVLPDGLKPEKSWREILEPLISRRGNGFQVNNIGTSSVFSLFENNATGFHPQPRRTTRKDANGDEVAYWEYQFMRKFIPRKLGHYEFAPVTLKGTFADGVQAGQLVGKQIYALAPGVEVTVKDVPLDGRPDSYIGAVGTFRVQAELVPTAAQVGDPMTLTVTLTGQGTLDDARPPAIAELPGVEKSFRTYEATEESQSNARRFTYSLRPLSTDVTEFPSIPVSYFDVDSDKYVTAHTDPISVTIHEAETLSGSEIVSAPSNAAGTGGDLEASAGGIFANDANLGSLRNEAIRPTRWVGAWAAMVAGWLAASFFVGHVKRVREDPALLRRRSAAGRAKAALQATESMSGASTTETCESLRRAITGLVADFANVPAAGLTPRDAADRLGVLGVDESLRNRTFEFLNECDAARYGIAPNDVSRLQKEAANLLNELIAQLKKPSNKALSPRLATTAVLLISLCASGCTAAPDLETTRKFQEAEKAFTEAKTADDFIRVARKYDQINGGDFVSGAALYNEGNAWMRAGETGRAIASYRQAQRYRPRDPYLAANLQNALRASGSNSQSSRNLGVAGYIFFWQQWLSYPEKFAVTTGLLVLMLTTALLSQLTAHSVLFRRIGIVVGVVCLLSVASAGWDWYRYDRTTHGVVTADEVIARKGNAESYAPAFTDPLAEGTEFVVLDKRGDWLQVRIGDSGTAWLPERDVVTY